MLTVAIVIGAGMIWLAWEAYTAPDDPFDKPFGDFPNLDSFVRASRDADVTSRHVGSPAASRLPAAGVLFGYRKSGADVSPFHRSTSNPEA